MIDLIIKRSDYEKIINHCERKLEEKYNDDETRERQAFGVITGKKTDSTIEITGVEILKKNFRFDNETSKKVNSFIEKYAIPGGIEISERAWAIDPIELNMILMNLSDEEEFLGTYHMHSYLSWSGDYPKELPTTLDRELNKGSDLINLIVHIGKENIKGIRAFFESDINFEYNLIIREENNEGKI